MTDNTEHCPDCDDTGVDDMFNEACTCPAGKSSD